MERIYVAGPSITEYEIERVSKAVATGWYEDAYGCIEEFEEKFKQYIGRKYAIAMPSCTSSIHIALLALGIQAGDEVIVPDITWIATSSPISYLGAMPIFADIDKTSWCISLDSIERCVTDKTKALIVVDLYGNMPEMQDILAFAETKDIFVIEDAAQALGSEYRGQKAGSFGAFSVYSFHGTKILTTGEGGMILTDDEELYKRCLKLRDLGRNNSDKLFWNDEVAHKYKMSNIQAALGLAQLARFEEILAFKRETFGWYSEALADMPGVVLNTVPDYAKSNYWMNSVVWDPVIYPVEKEAVMQRMKEQGNIDTRPFFYPLSDMPAYTHLPKRNYRERNSTAYTMTPYAMNLPSSMKMNQTTVGFVTDMFQSILESHKK